MPNFKERYLLLIAAISLAIPVACVIKEAYSSPIKRHYRVPQSDFAAALNSLQNARIRKDRNEIIAALVSLSRLYVLDGDTMKASMILDDYLEEETRSKKERAVLLSALADVFRNRQGEHGYSLARERYILALDEARALGDKQMGLSLSIKLVNLYYLQASDDREAWPRRMKAVDAGLETIASAESIADELDSLQAITALHNYSVLIEVEKKRLALSDMTDSL